MQTVEETLDTIGDQLVSGFEALRKIQVDSAGKVNTTRDRQILLALEGRVDYWLKTWRALPSEICPEAEPLLAQGIALAEICRRVLDFAVPAKEEHEQAEVSDQAAG